MLLEVMGTRCASPIRKGRSLPGADLRPDTALLDIGLPDMSGYEVGRTDATTRVSYPARPRSQSYEEGYSVAAAARALARRRAQSPDTRE